MVINSISTNDIVSRRKKVLSLTKITVKWFRNFLKNSKLQTIGLCAYKPNDLGSHKSTLKCKTI